MMLHACDKISGEATRYCDADGSWSEPSVLNCVSTVFLDIEQLVSYGAYFVSKIRKLIFRVLNTM